MDVKLNKINIFYTEIDYLEIAFTQFGSNNYNDKLRRTKENLKYLAEFFYNNKYSNRALNVASSSKSSYYASSIMSNNRRAN